MDSYKKFLSEHPTSVFAQDPPGDDDWIFKYARDLYEYHAAVRSRPRPKTRKSSDCTRFMVSFKAEDGTRQGFIDRFGNLVIRPIFKEAGGFSEGLARVMLNRKWGYIDKFARLRILTLFIEAQDFSEDLAAIRTIDGWGYIDKEGNEVILPQYKSAEPFGNGLALVEEEGGHLLFIDKSGRTTHRILEEVSVIKQYSEGLVGVEVRRGRYRWSGGRDLLAWGFIDRHGRFVIPAQYWSIGHFSEGLAPAGLQEIKPAPPFSVIIPSGTVQFFDEERSSWGYINSSGNFVIPPQFYSATSFSEGLARVRTHGTEREGYIDKKGELVISDRFRSARDFSGGLAAVLLNSGWGYINMQGNVVIPGIFHSAEDFCEGIARIEFGERRWGYIDIHGVPIWASV